MSKIQIADEVDFQYLKLKAVVERKAIQKDKYQKVSWRVVEEVKEKYKLD